MKTSKFKMTELGPIPEEWEVKPFSECFTLIRNNTYARECLTDHPGSVANVHYGDVLIKYGAVLDFAKNAVPYLKSDVKPNKDMLRDGDLVFADTAEDEAVGKAVEVQGLKSRMAVAGLHTVASRPHDGLFAPRYLGYYINSAAYHNQLLTLITGTKVSSVSRAGFLSTYVAIPPKGEQEKIAEALSDIDELILALGKLIEKKRNIKTGAMQELLTGKTRLSGFKGKWVEKTFCEFISRFATGLNPRQNFKLNSGGNNYYITIKDFKNGKISFNGCDKIDDLALRLINERSDLRAGDLLFSSIGRVGDAYVIKETPSNWNINESVFALRPDARQMDVNFLYYLVKSNAVQERLTSGITGSTLTGIKIGELRGVVCFYPSDVVEQKAIAAVLSDMDAEIAALEAKRAKYESIKQGMMQELLTGKTRLKGE